MNKKRNFQLKLLMIVRKKNKSLVDKMQLRESAVNDAESNPLASWNAAFRAIPPTDVASTRDTLSVRSDSPHPYPSPLETSLPPLLPPLQHRYHQ